MRSQSNHFRKSIGILLGGIITAAILLVLVSCSGGNSNDVQISPEQAEINQLKEENETLHKALDKVLADLEKAEAKNAELEAEKLKAEEQNKAEDIQENQEEAPQAPDRSCPSSAQSGGFVGRRMVLSGFLRRWLF